MHLVYTCIPISLQCVPCGVMWACESNVPWVAHGTPTVYSQTLYVCPHGVIFPIGA